MKLFSSILLIAVCISLFTSCKEEHKNAAQLEAKMRKLDKLDWLVAKWEMLSDEGKFTEEWKQINDTLLEGKGIMISEKGDTVFKEFIQLVERNDSVFYIASVPSQNDGAAVYFSMQSIDSVTSVFENKLHDFPQRIVYNRLSAATMIATIEGLQNGSNHKEVFHFTKAE